MSELRARVDAMRPEREGPTRTADPRPPDNFPGRGNYVPYIAFGLCGFLLFDVAFGILWSAQVLAQHDAAAWEAHLARFANPLWIVWHVFCLAALTWFALRFFGLFPKTQPNVKIGPFQRPSLAVIGGLLNVTFAVVTFIAVLVLGGGLL